MRPLTHIHSSGNSWEVFHSIWVMQEYGFLESWTKMLHFDSISYPPYPGVLALRNNEEVVIKPSATEIIFLDPIKGLVKKIGHSCYIVLLSLFLINDKNAKTFLPLGFSPLPSPYPSTPSWNTSSFGKLKRVFENFSKLLKGIKVFSIGKNVRM